MLSVLPEIKKVSIEWVELISDGIAEDELEIFNSVLERMQSRAREIVQNQEDNK
jgi:hypothetical protein